MVGGANLLAVTLEPLRLVRDVAGVEGKFHAPGEGVLEVDVDVVPRREILVEARGGAVLGARLQAGRVVGRATLAAPIVVGHPGTDRLFVPAQADVAGGVDESGKGGAFRAGQGQLR